MPQFGQMFTTSCLTRLGSRRCGMRKTGGLIVRGREPGRDGRLDTVELVHRADAFELPLLNPQLRRELRLVATHLLAEPLAVLAPDEHFDRVTEREVEGERVVDDGVDDQEATGGPQRSPYSSVRRGMLSRSTSSPCRDAIAPSAAGSGGPA